MLMRLQTTSVKELFLTYRLLFWPFSSFKKQPAHLGLLNLRFTQPWGGKFGFGNSACG